MKRSALPLVLGVYGLVRLVFDLHLLASVPELVGAIAGAVVGQQGAYADAVAWRRSRRRELQEADGGFGLLIGQHLGKGHARVIVDGHMQSQEAGMLAACRAAVHRRAG